jgi:MOSC domain-containing protein YiiM
MTIKIDFEFPTQYGTFRDALHLPDDHSFTDEQITAMKQERLDNWLFAVENPLEPEPETVEVDGVTYEKVEIDGQTVLKPVEV